MLSLDGSAPNQVFDAWGLSDSDYYVALGGTSLHPVIAHPNGQTWGLDMLPAGDQVTSLGGAVHAQAPELLSQLTVLAPTDTNKSTIFRASGTFGMNPWTMESIGAPSNALAVLGESDALLSVASTTNFADGQVQRWNGTLWNRMDLPDLGVVYSLRKLRMLDATHVYAIGYSGGADMGSNVFAAFDGSQWKARRVPAECGNLHDVAAASPDRVYTIGTVFSIARRHLCRVSPDLATWTVVDESGVPNGGDEPRLVATNGGTVLTIVSTYMSHGPSTVRAMHNDSPATTCTISPGLGNVVAWSAPGSPNIHVFTGPQAGETTPVRHLVARVDP
jgi:hypothetical protein